MFLDRDGIINRAVVRDGRPYPPATLEEFDLLPGVERAIHALRKAGFLIVVVTNQPDVATGVQRREVVETLAKELKAKYIFPEVSQKVGQALRDKLAHGDYEAAATAPAFAEALGKDLRTLGQDLHFRVGFDPDFKPGPESEDRPPTKEEIVQMRQEMQQAGYGVAKVERLPGNIGYLDLRGFGPTAFVGAAYTSALSLLTGTEAC